MHRNSIFLHSVLSLSLIFGITACALFSDDPTPDSDTAQDSDTALADTVSDSTSGDSASQAAADSSQALQETQQLSSVEILWQVPGESVERYHLRYGIQPESLDTEVIVAVAELEKIDHPDHGPLFRYVIAAIPADQTVFFTIRAENQYGISPESPVQKVEPQ